MENLTPQFPRFPEQGKPPLKTKKTVHSLVRLLAEDGKSDLRLIEARALRLEQLTGEIVDRSRSIFAYPELAIEMDEDGALQYASYPSNVEREPPYPANGDGHSVSFYQ